jgi:hypothetical protein
MRPSLFLLLMFLLTVCTQKVQSNIIPVLGASPELNLTSPTPGVAGMDNTLSVSGATPNERVYFIYGFVPGSTAIPGCPGDSAGINSPRILGFSEARTILFQAVEIANCMVSNLVEYTFAPGSFERTYGGSGDDIGSSVQQTTDGDYIVAGSTYSFGTGSSDVYLIKTDPSGDTLWTRTYGGSDIDYGYSVLQTTDGDYIVAGETQSFGAGPGDVYLIKTDPSGDTLWTRTYGGNGHDWGQSVQQTTDGGYIVSGQTNSFGPGQADVYLIKTDAVGDTLWTRTYGGSGRDYGSSVQQTTDGGYIVAGGTYSFGTGGKDVYLIKTDPSGDTLWTRTYGGSGDDIGSSVQQTTDGGYIVAGRTDSFGAGGYDVYLIKTDPDGLVGTYEDDSQMRRTPEK